MCESEAHGFEVSGEEAEWLPKDLKKIFTLDIPSEESSLVFKYKLLVSKVIGSIAFDLSQGISQENDTNKPFPTPPPQSHKNDA